MENDLLARVRSQVFDLLEPADAPHTPFAKGFDRIEKIGEGAFGTIWRARDRALDKEVALKVLGGKGCTASVAEHFLREARTLASIDHPNVLRIHSVEEQEGEIVLSLELVAGLTLEEWVRTHGPMSAREAAQIGIDLCKALAAIHSHGLIHGDVKHSNVMRAAGGRIVLLDFGLSRFASGSGKRAGSPASPQGTPLYMAPEAFDAPGAVDRRADLYSLGVLLYWLVARGYPIEAVDIDELRERLSHKERIPLRDRRPELPTPYVRIVHRLLSPDPADRPGSAGAVEAELAGFLHGDGLRAADATEQPATKPRKTRRLALAGLGMLAVAALGYFELGKDRSAAGAEQSGALARLFELQGSQRVELGEFSTLAQGDWFVVEARPPRDGYLYLLDEDLDGGVNLLFPREACELTNPVPGGQVVELPRACGEEPYRLGPNSSAGNRDGLLLVFSPTPLDWVSTEVHGFRAQKSRSKAAPRPATDGAFEIESGRSRRSRLRLFPFLEGVVERLDSEAGIEHRLWEILAE